MAHKTAAILTLLGHFLFHEQTVLVQAKQESDPIHQRRHLRNTNVKEAMLLRDAHLDDSKSLNRNLVQCTDLELEIQFDNFAQEVGWELYEIEQYSFYESEWYNTSYSNAAVSRNICVPPGSYNFTMYDFAFDGLCCAFGQGYFQLTLDGVEIKKLGEYGLMDWTSFDVVGSPTVSPAPTNAPTPFVPWPTALPTLAPTVTCSSDEVIMGVEIMMDYSPEALSWILTDSSSNAVLSSEPFAMETYNSIVYREYCVSLGIYTFTIESLYDYGLWGGFYKVLVNGEIIADGGVFKKRESKTISIPSVPTQAPTSGPTISCSSDESLFEIKIKLDPYPYWVSWNVTNSAKILVLEGGDYTDEQALQEVGGQVCLRQDIYTLTVTYEFYAGSGYLKAFVDGVPIKFVEGVLGEYIYGFEELSYFATQDASLWPTASPQPSASPTVTPQPTPLWTAPPSPSSWTSWPTPLWTSYPTPSSWTAYPTWTEPTLAPTVKCASDESTFEVDIYLDYIQNATSWQMTDSSGSVLISGQDYKSFDWSVHKELCLLAGSYMFTIFDDNGDGICCGNGSGLYKLSLDGVVVKKGGVFGSDESTVIVSAPA